MKTQLELREKDLRCKLAESCVAHGEMKERNDERRQMIDDLNRKCTELVSVVVLFVRTCVLGNSGSVLCKAVCCGSCYAVWCTIRMYV